MIRKILLSAVLLAALPLVASSSSAARCQEWNAASPAQHHRVGDLDIVGGHGYGSGNHSSTYYSPPQPMGAYGDPKRRAAQGGYIQFANKKIVVHFNLFGPLDETDTTHIYDTAFGACVSYKEIGVNTGEKCVKTSKKGGRQPTQWGTWVPCGGY